MKFNYLCAFISIMSLVSCSGDIGRVEPGDIKYIPFTDNYAVGTDSTIVIIEREGGKTVNTIKRH